MTSSRTAPTAGPAALSVSPGAERAPVDASPARARWVDDARGIGIILVVFGHAIGGILSAGITDPDGGYSTAFQSIYSFHMPLFFFLSGLFCRRYERGDSGTHLAKSARRILYPYLIWSIVTLTVISSLGTLVNRPFEASWYRYVAILWAPPAQLWFLFGLFALNLIYILLLRVVGAGALLAVALLARFAPVVFDLPEVVKLTTTYSLFFAIGVLSTKQIFQAIGHMGLAKARNAALAAFLLWAVVVAVTLSSGFYYLSPVMIPASFLGTAMVVLAAVALAQTSAADILGYLGRISMPIFLLHVLFVAGTRIVFVKLFHVETAGLLLPVLVLAGLTGPIVVYELGRLLRLTGIMGFE